MLDIEILEHAEVEKAVRIFHRDGFVVIKNALTAKQLAFAQSGTARVIAEQMAEIALESGNRGYARYSSGPQHHHPEFAQFIDLPTILPIVDAIWGSSDYVCSGCGGDYSAPGAKIQRLHGDVGEGGDDLEDPLGQVTIKDVPTPIITVNFPMVEFKEINGAIRIVPGTHRTRIPKPTLEEEPERMKRSIICVPAGTALIRDVRCWHGGSANNSDEIRPMIGVSYYAPWFRFRGRQPSLPRELYDSLSSRGKELASLIVQP